MTLDPAFVRLTTNNHYLINIQNDALPFISINLCSAHDKSRSKACHRRFFSGSRNEARNAPKEMHGGVEVTTANPLNPECCSTESKERHMAARRRVARMYLYVSVPEFSSADGGEAPTASHIEAGWSAGSSRAASRQPTDRRNYRRFKSAEHRLMAWDRARTTSRGGSEQPSRS